DIVITDEQLTLWPNPNDGRSVNLAFTCLDTSDDLVTITLVDATGKLAHTARIARPQDQQTIRLELPTDLSPGLYLVNIQVGERMFNERLVLQR
ncbi:MAG TPA: T9SS type A sorting domain-containing protein, partial [Flavobacteriales bacterium]|nr:T9SS type A sorting domain-containing protein [Flavobacteriales bacterium]